MKSPKDINKANADFWRRHKDDVEKYGRQNPEALTGIADLAEKLIQEGFVNEPGFASHTSLEAAVKLAQNNTHINVASNGGHAKHKNSKRYKFEIVERYKNEKARFESKDEAAEAYTKEWPLEFSTIRKYLKNL